MVLGNEYTLLSNDWLHLSLKLSKNIILFLVLQHNVADREETASFLAKYSNNNSNKGKYRTLKLKLLN